MSVNNNNNNNKELLDFNVFGNNPYADITTTSNNGPFAPINNNTDTVNPFNTEYPNNNTNTTFGNFPPLGTYNNNNNNKYSYPTLPLNIALELSQLRNQMHNKTDRIQNCLMNLGKCSISNADNTAPDQTAAADILDSLFGKNPNGLIKYWQGQLAQITSDLPKSGSQQSIQQNKASLLAAKQELQNIQKLADKLNKTLNYAEQMSQQRAAFDDLIENGLKQIDIQPNLWNDNDIVSCMNEITDLHKLTEFYTKFSNKSNDVKEAYNNKVQELVKNDGLEELADKAKQSKNQEETQVLVQIMEQKAEEVDDVTSLLNDYTSYTTHQYDKGKTIILDRIKKLINEAEMDKLSAICQGINDASNNVPQELKNALKSKITQLIQAANTPATLQELYEKFEEPIKEAVTPNFVKTEFVKQVSHLIDTDLQQNYQSQQAFDPKKLDKQLKSLKEKIQEYGNLDPEFAKIAINKIRETVNTILEEGNFDNIPIPGQESAAITTAIDELTRQLKTIPVQNRLYEDSLHRKEQTFGGLNFVPNADKTRADRFKQEEQDYQKVIQNFDAIVTKNHTDLVKNVNEFNGKTKANIDVSPANGAANSYDEVFQKSTAALETIKNDVARILQDPTLRELFDNSIQIDDIDNLEKSTLQRLNMQLDNVIRDANAKIQQITNDLADQLEDIEPIVPLRDLSDASVQTLKASLENMRKAIKDNKKKQAEDLQKKEEEKEDGTKEIPDEIINDPEVQAQKDVVTKLLNKNTCAISANGAAELLKQAEELEKYNKLVEKKIRDKKKKDEEDKKKKEEEDKKKKEDREKKKKEKEKKAKEKEEKQKQQQAKNLDLAQENLVKQEYQQKVDKLEQYKKDNPEPEANVGLCVLTFILGVFPLFIYLASLNGDKKEYNAEIQKLNKDVQDAKAAYDAKHNENMQKYNTPNSIKIIKNASPAFNSQNLVKEPLQKQ